MDKKIYIGSDDDVRTAYVDCSIEMTKEEIVLQLRQIRESLSGSEVRFVRGDDTPVIVPESVSEVLTNLSKKNFYSATKDVLATALAYYLSDPRNASETVHTRGENDLDVLGRAVARQAALGISKVNEIMGEGAVKIHRRYWSTEVRLSRHLKNFTAWKMPSRFTRFDRHEEFFLRLKPAISDKYIREVYPLQSDALWTLPGGDGDYMIVDRQNSVAVTLNMAGVMTEAGIIGPAATKLLTKNDIKTFLARCGADTVSDEVNALTGSPRWEPEVSLQLLPVLGYMLIIASGLFPETGRRSGKGETRLFRSNDLAETVSVIVHLLDRINYFPQMVKALLPDIAGLTTSQIRTMGVGTAFITVMGLLKDAVESRWSSVDNILAESYRLLYKSDSDLLVSLYENWPVITRTGTGKKGDKVTPDRALSDLTFTFLRGVLFFLGSLGVVEMAFDRRTHTPTAPFAALKYVRLTPLGLYVLGRGPKPDLRSDDRYSGRYELVDDPMIIVSLESDNPYNAMLDRIGIRHGSRWEVTPASVLSQCSNVNDIESIYSDLRRYICSEPSAVWQAFFKHLIDNAGENSLRPSKERFTVLNVNPDNRELLAFLATDPAVRELIVKAEGYRILVAAGNMDRLRQALRRGGFLI